jgi:hypothetical protein
MAEKYNASISESHFVIAKGTEALQQKMLARS